MKSILITGASSGIGHQLALEFGARGYDLALCSRRMDALQSLRSEIKARHPERRVEIYALDVTDYDELPRHIEEAARALGKLDIIVAGAGLGSAGRVGGGNFAADRAVIEANVIGAMATLDAAVTFFRRQGFGQAVAISSVAAFRGLPGSASYSASKAAIAVYAEAMRAELYNSPIKVTTLFPGYIDTPLNRKIKNRPFLVSVEKGCRIIADLIEREVQESTVPVFPWNIMKYILRLLPVSRVARLG
ncbi:MAG: SDR family oxidoreductase [Leptospirales bacterium]|nr:SDR family oxidoreductase [Leptospirales bacterium]